MCILNFRYSLWNFGCIFWNFRCIFWNFRCIFWISDVYSVWRIGITISPVSVSQFSVISCSFSCLIFNSNLSFQCQFSSFQFQFSVFSFQFSVFSFRFSFSIFGFSYRWFPGSTKLICNVDASLHRVVYVRNNARTERAQWADAEIHLEVNKHAGGPWRPPQPLLKLKLNC